MRSTAIYLYIIYKFSHQIFYVYFSRIIYELACRSPFPRNHFSRVNLLEVNFSVNERSVQCHLMTYTHFESISERLIVFLHRKSARGKFRNSHSKNLYLERNKMFVRLMLFVKHQKHINPMTQFVNIMFGRFHWSNAFVFYVRCNYEYYMSPLSERIDIFFHMHATIACKAYQDSFDKTIFLYKVREFSYKKL